MPAIHTPADALYPQSTAQFSPAQTARLAAHPDFRARGRALAQELASHPQRWSQACARFDAWARGVLTSAR